MSALTTITRGRFPATGTSILTNGLLIRYFIEESVVFTDVYTSTSVTSDRRTLRGSYPVRSLTGLSAKTTVSDIFRLMLERDFSYMERSSHVVVMSVGSPLRISVTYKDWEKIQSLFSTPEVEALYQMRGMSIDAKIETLKPLILF